MPYIHTYRLSLCVISHRLFIPLKPNGTLGNSNGFHPFFGRDSEGKENVCEEDIFEIDLQTCDKPFQGGRFPVPHPFSLRFPHRRFSYK